MNEKLSEIQFVSFDTETTGQYPLTAEVCELAAVKYQNGKIIDTFATLLKPSRPMLEANIKIHGITNEMVASAPLMAEKISSFRDFIDGSVVIAHHAPFDLGFMTIEFEKANLALPELPAICTSLLSRKLIPESSNHRLQTLIGFLKIEKGQAHRALDDAQACLQVALKCMERLPEADLGQLLEAQGGTLSWQRFSLRDLIKTEVYKRLVYVTEKGISFEMIYQGGSNPGKPRIIISEGLVRSLNGDFLVAREPNAEQTKRYLLDKIESVEY